MADDKDDKHAREAEDAVEASPDWLVDDGEESESTYDEGPEGEVSGNPPIIPIDPGGSSHGVDWEAEFRLFPAEKDHRSATNVLRGTGAQGGVDVIWVDDIGSGTGKKAIVNLVLVILLVAAMGGGGYAFLEVSSKDTLEEKRREKQVQEDKYLAEQLAQQKKYGVLRVETNPNQAEVYKNGQKVVVTDEATGEEQPGLTPMNMMNLDIGETYQLEIKKDGYEPFGFTVAEHLWTKDPGTEDFKFFKMVDLTPIFCEYWFLYDAKKREEVKFEERGECGTYHDDASQEGVSITECTCKMPPEGWTEEQIKELIEKRNKKKQELEEKTPKEEDAKGKK